MWLIIIWFMIGAAVGGGMSWLMENRSSLSQLASVIIGVVAAEVGGHVFLLFGHALVGEGPEAIASFVAAAVAAAVCVFVAGLIKK
jgi:uncharacterized membrane protein YeaQ/YmgE (transglycosylase-associated protein family)